MKIVSLDDTIYFDIACKWVVSFIDYIRQCAILHKIFFSFLLCIHSNFSYLFLRSFDIVYSDYLIISKKPLMVILMILYTTDPGSLLFHLVVVYIDQEGIWILIQGMTSNDDLWTKDPVQWAKHKIESHEQHWIFFFPVWLNNEWLVHNIIDVNVKTFFPGLLRFIINYNRRKYLSLLLDL